MTDPGPSSEQVTPNSTATLDSIFQASLASPTHGTPQPAVLETLRSNQELRQALSQADARLRQTASQTDFRECFGVGSPAPARGPGGHPKRLDLMLRLAFAFGLGIPDHVLRHHLDQDDNTDHEIPANINMPTVPEDLSVPQDRAVSLAS
jgi:hypothetical protein